MTTDDRAVTWDAYRTWPDDQRWEVIGGEAFAMTPSPASRHQLVATNMVGELLPAFRQGTCRLVAAPIDVKLSDQDIVQPDLLVVCTPDQIRTTHIEGPPAPVVEILSPSTLRHDRVRKLSLYARAGIKEYWMVTPYPSLVEVFVLTEVGYRLEAGYEPPEVLRSPAFPEFSLDLSRVFDIPIDPDERIQVVRESPPPVGISMPSPRWAGRD